MRLPARGKSSRLQKCGLSLFLLLWLVAGSPTPAVQEPVVSTSTVSGIVRTTEGTPIPGATVRLINTDTNKVWLSWTDESGKFEFPQIAAGRYRIEASQLGFVQTSSIVEVPVVPPGPVPVVLRVATLAELSAAPATPANKPHATGNRSSAQNPSANSSNAPGQRGARAQLPAGAANAVREGLAGGFEETELTGEGTNTPGAEANGAANSNPQAEVSLSANANSNATSDSFLLQGTVGQSLTSNGPGGFGGPGGIVPGTPGDNGGRGGRGAGQLFGQNGPGGPGGGPGGGGGGPGGMFGGRGRLNRQTVNRVRFSFYDRYENSAFDAKPYSLTGNQVPKPSHYDERFGGNLGGPLKIPHIYNGSDRTYFFINYQHEIQSSALDTYSTVPTTAERSGDFCGLGVTIYNPFSNFTGPRTPLGNGCQIPAIDSAAAGLLAFYPLPNLPGMVQNYLLQTTVPINNDILNLHVLH